MKGILDSFLAILIFYAFMAPKVEKNRLFLRFFVNFYDKGYKNGIKLPQQLMRMVILANYKNH